MEKEGIVCHILNGKATSAANSKTDQTGDGGSAYLTRDTVRWLRHRREEWKIAEGPVFMRVLNGGRIGEPLLPDSVSGILKRVAVFLGFKEKDAALGCGYSIRVGATQDLLALNIHLGSATQADRRKSNGMPMRYGEQVMIARGGIARAVSMPRERCTRWKGRSKKRLARFA